MKMELISYHHTLHHLIRLWFIQFQFKARIVINIAIGVLISAAFYDTGNNADRILNNTAVLILNLYAIFFTSIASAVVVCK